MLSIEKIQVLQQTLLFKDLSLGVIEAIAEETEEKKMLKDEIIFSEGDEGNGLYIIASGKVEVLQRGKQTAILSKNDYFGELALLDNAKRMATVKALEGGELLFIEKLMFDRITDDLPEVLQQVVMIIMRYLRSYIPKAFQ